MSFVNRRGLARAPVGRAVVDQSDRSAANAARLRRAAHAAFEHLERRQFLSAAPSPHIAPGDPGNGPAAEGSNYVLALSVEGSGYAPIQHWTINWGDGATQAVDGNPSSVTHQYADGDDNFSVTASATNADGTYDATAPGNGAPAPTGNPDASFGDAGTARTDFIAPGVNSDNSTAVAVIAPDNKVVAAGTTMDPNSGSMRWAVTRYNADGTTDTSFGDDGVVTTGMGSGFSQHVGGVVIQADGKIVVGGRFDDNTTDGIALARYNVDGSLDASFGDGGIVRTPRGQQATLSAIALDGDGQIVAFGAEGPNENWLVTRYNPDGSLDGSFTGGGITTLNFSTLNFAGAIAFGPGGSIYLSGQAADGGASFGSDIAVARLNANGQLDPTFGSGGKARINIGGTVTNDTEQAPAMLVDAAGVATIGGSMELPGEAGTFALVRVNANGLLDHSFGDDDGHGGRTGYTLTNVGYNEYTGGLVRQGDKILAVGHAQFTEAGNSEFTFVRYNTSDGSLDTFGDNGVKHTAVGYTDLTAGVTVAPDGKVVFSGSNGIYPTDFQVARFNGDGTLDNEFGIGGTATTDIPGSADDRGRRMAIQPGGKMLVAGTSNAAYSADLALARYNTDGSLDDTFGHLGRAVVPDFGGIDVNGVAFAAGGKILVSGNFGGHAIVLRLDADGSLDTTWGGGAGYVNAGPDSGPTFVCSSMTLAAGGKIIVGGTVQNSFAAVQLNESGSIDGAFGVEGLARVHVGSTAGDATPGDGQSEQSLDVAIDSQGRIVLSGFVQRSGGNENFAVARFLSNGSVDTTFGSEDDGGVEVDFGANAADGNAIAILADDRIAVAGSLFHGDDPSQIALAEFNADGMPDTGFGAGGRAVSTFAGRSTGNDLLATSDGKLWVTGTYVEGDQPKGLGVFRFDSAGGADETFGAGGVVTGSAGFEGNAIAQQADGKVATAGTAEDLFASGDFFVTRFGLGSGSGGASSLPVHVVNVAPTLALTGATSGVRQQTLNFNGSLTDPGADTWTAIVNYNDGSPAATVALGAGKTFALSHAFTASGTFNVTVTVTDKDGGAGSAVLPVTIQAAQLQQDPAFPGDATKQMLVVGGTGGADVVNIAPSNGKVAVNIGGASAGSFSPTTRVVVYGGAGNDTVHVAGGVNVVSEIIGGAGNDTLDGGNGGAIISGGDGNDVVTGGSGRDVLIGGMGADVVTGNAGDDILVAGYTAYDADPAALFQIWQSWSRSDRTYAQRIADLTSSSSPFGLRTEGAAATGQTVFDDSRTDTIALALQSIDVLAGGAGTDWFLYNYTDGGVQDIVSYVSGETRSDIDVT